MRYIFFVLIIGLSSCGSNTKPDKILSPQEVQKPITIDSLSVVTAWNLSHHQVADTSYFYYYKEEISGKNSIMVTINKYEIGDYTTFPGEVTEDDEGNQTQEDDIVVRITSKAKILKD